MSMKARLVALSLAGVAIILPLLLLDRGSFYFYTAWLILYYVILALSWNISLLAGELSLANYGYLGLGAYSYSLAVSSWHDVGLGLLLSTVIPLLCMIPFYFALRFERVILAVTTFLIPFTFVTFIQLFHPTGVYLPFPLPLDVSYYLLAAELLASVAITIYLSWTNLGLSFTSLYCDERVAEASGVNTRILKLIAFYVPVPLTGLAGALVASSQGYVDTSTVFGFDDLIIMVLGVLLIAPRTLLGTMAGAVVVTLLSITLQVYFPYAHLEIFGGLILVVVLLKPVATRYLKRGFSTHGLRSFSR